MLSYVVVVVVPRVFTAAGVPGFAVAGGVAVAVVVVVSVVCHGACISLIRRIVTAVWWLAERRVRRVSKIEIAPVNDLHFSYFMCVERACGGGWRVEGLCGIGGGIINIYIFYCQSVGPFLFFPFLRVALVLLFHCCNNCRGSFHFLMWYAALW